MGGTGLGHRPQIPHNPNTYLTSTVAPASVNFLLDGLGFVLGNAFFNGLRRAIHQVLGFFQSKTGDFAYRLDNIDLVGAHCGQNDGKFRLFLGRSPLPLPRRPPPSREPLPLPKPQTRLKLLDQFRRFQQRQTND